MRRDRYNELKNECSLYLTKQALISFILGAAMATASILLAKQLSNLHSNLKLSEANRTGLVQEVQNPHKELIQVLRNAANEDNTVILTFINEAFAARGSLLDLFLESFHAGDNIEGFLNNIVFINMDQNAYDRCMSIHLHCYFLKTGGAYFNSEKGFMSKDYLELMCVRNKFQMTILELGFNFLFTDIDVLWFRDPFKHITILGPHILIASDFFVDDSDSVDNTPNGGFLYVKSCKKSLEFYKMWYESRHKYPGQHDQDVFRAIKADAISQIKVRIKFLDTAYCGGFCQLSNDLSKICTLHANYCVGLKNKIHDLRRAIEDWRNYSAKPDGNFKWRVPAKCIH